MKNKLVIKNRVYYFHPRHIAYAGSRDGYVVHAITRIPTIGINNEKGYLEFAVEDDWRLIQVHDFIWECFHGLLKEGEKIKHINKRRDDNRLENLKLCSSNDIILKGCIFRQMTARVALKSVRTYQP